MTASASAPANDLARALSTARGRALRARELLGSTDPDDLHFLAMELRTLRREAANLGRPDIARLAMEVEAAAQAGSEQDLERGRTPQGRAARRLEALLGRLDSERNRTEDGGGRHGRRVLVVDPNPFTARLLAHVLKEGGCEVRVAGTTDEALDRPPIDSLKSPGEARWKSSASREFPTDRFTRSCT